MNQPQPPQRDEIVVSQEGRLTLRFLEYLDSLDSQITLNTAEETSEQVGGNVTSLLMGYISDLERRVSALEP